MQIRRFFYRSMTLQNLSNCINGAIKITTMVILVLLNLLILKEFVVIFYDFINNHEYANLIICITYHLLKEVCLSFRMRPSLVI